MKVGQYTNTDGDFRSRYLVHKIMNKTAEVSTLMSYKFSDFTGDICYRYPLSLLKQQIEGAVYRPFKA